MKVLPFTIPVPHDHTVIMQEEVLPHFYTHLHRHAEIQITWIKEGDGTLIAGSSMHPFSGGEIYFLGANLPHLFKSDPVYFHADNNKRVRTVSIFFNPQAKLSYLFSLPEMSPVNAFVRQWQNGFKIPDGYYAEIAPMISEMQHTSGAQLLSAFINMLHVISRIEGLLPLSSENYTGALTDPEGMRIASVYNYIIQNYNRGLTLEDAAAQAHLTPTAFCRYFKKHTRLTFVNFVNKIRINEACKQLVNGRGESIASVAYNCGFNSITNFNYVFKNVTGLSPSEYIGNYARTVK